MVRSTLTVADEFRARFAAGESPRGFSVAVFDKTFRRGTLEALKELGKTWSASLDRAQDWVRIFL